MKSLLVVDDSPDDVELLRIALDDHHIANNVDVVCDGVEAIEWLGDESHPLPAVVLLDLNLPRLGGIEVLRRIRADARTAHLPVVVLTSSREERDLIESYELGVNSYVRKPVQFGEFTDAVRHLGIYWLLLNELPPAGAGGGPNA